MQILTVLARPWQAVNWVKPYQVIWWVVGNAISPDVVVSIVSILLFTLCEPFVLLASVVRNEVQDHLHTCDRTMFLILLIQNTNISGFHIHWEVIDMQNMREYTLNLI